MSHPNHFGTHAVWKDPKGEKSKTAPKKKVYIACQRFKSLCPYKNSCCSFIAEKVEQKWIWINHL